MLHLIFQSPVKTVTLERMARGDVAVFMESAVLSLMQSGNCAEALSSMLSTNRLYALSEDMVIRGIQAAELVPGLEVVDYAGLVVLTTENPLICSWC
jgi:tRNA 2-thiouridine synthesizing protein B